jgi:glycosyltransferase involved in cell wall biosynthesis
VKVLFTSPALFGAKGVYGGGERYAHRLARAVAGNVERATLLASADRDDEWTDGPLRVVARRPWAWVRGQRANPLPRGLVAELVAADVVHCFQQHIVATSLAILAGRVFRKPVFATDLGGGGWDLSAYVDTARWSAGLLHLSRYAREVAGRTGNPADAVLLGGTDGPVTRQGEDRGQVLCVGRLLPHKGADLLLEAAESHWDVVIVGAPLDPRYEADLRRLAAGTRVTFLPSADDAALEAAYGAAAVVVVPSRWRDRYGTESRVPELLGLVALEAAARGIPVVASDVASLPEIVEDGVTGLLFPSGDAAALRAGVNALLADPASRLAMGRAAQVRVAERFTWARAAAVAIGAYERALRGET